ncbi:DUF7666 domain-containing protein [Burkholderia aenigmatica]|uniref:DUF7666 domain-containing protein n=1 Tax=Burkholderia aenigmatica TaxID=2015348 RepID=UPI00264E5842|nr:hypothetical protein [Burkholderia aenigmatica]MDN7881384.1 hypothetical protein [Burkholderia aenigmatica]
MDDKTIQAYKGFDKDLRCRDFQYEVGKTYEHVGPVRACGSGFHACENPLDVWAYYPVNQSRFCKVTLSGDLSRDDGDSKVAARRITLDVEIGIPQIITDAVKYLLDLAKEATDLAKSLPKLESKDHTDNGVADTQIGTSGYGTRIGTSGNSTQIGTSGYGTQIGTSGNSTQIGTSGNSTQIGTSGYGTRIGTSGDSTQIGTSGDSTRIGTSGYGTRIGTSGDSTRIGTSGNSTQIGTSGDSTQIDQQGDNAVIACAGLDAVFKTDVGGSVAIAYWNHAEQRVRFAVGYVGENLKARTRYRVDNAGQFVEVSE